MNYYSDFTIAQYDTPPVYKYPSDKKTDLAAGLMPYGIVADAPVTETYQTEYYNSKENYAMLTNGTLATIPDCKDPAFFHFTGGVGRAIVFKFDGISAVSGVRVGFLRQDSTGVRLPRDFCVKVSEDGKSWQRVVKVRGLSCLENPSRFDFEKTFPTIKALYVVIEFDVACHVWIDSISIYGTQTIPEDALSVVNDPEDEREQARFINKYPDYSDFLGLHNVLLSYNCVPPENVGDVHRGLIDEEQYLPYVAYLDKDGNIKDTLFDSFLYLPYSVYTYSELYKCADGWKYYVDNVFADGYNLDALEKTVIKVGEALGIKDYGVKVFFSILCSKVHYGKFPEKFGDIDGDGVDEDMDTLRDRKKALKWIIDIQLEKFKAKGYSRLDLGGFYWFEEDINYSDACTGDLLSYAREYLHSLGLKFFWIPYYLACGFRDWKENGFDIACMQPNYAFNMKIPKQRLYDNAATSKLLGLCTELEIGGTNPEHIENFKNYLDVGAETGYMNTIKMYYQGGVPGEFYKACKSEDALLRSIYDDLYEFAKEKYISRKDRT